MRLRHRPLATLLLLMGLHLGTSAIVSAEDPDSATIASGGGDLASFAGPDQVDNQIASDEAQEESWLDLTFLDSYFDFKKRLKESSGFSFGADYSAVYLKANKSPGFDRAASGMLRLFGSWDLVGRNSGNTGAIVFKVENRHKYTDISPFDFGFNLGYAGIIEPPYSDQKWRWTNLYWRQRLLNGRVSFIVGFVDATDYVDIYALASPWLHFMNFAFSTGSASMALPNDALLGVAAAGYLSKELYVIGGIGDAGSDPTDPLSGFDRIVNVNEYFSSLEFGWTSGKDRIYFDNFHVTVWNIDGRSATGDPEGWGLNFSGTTFIGDRLLPFVRGGYAQDGGSLLQKSLSAGFGYQWKPGQDLLGFGVNWGQPNETTLGPDLPDQYTLELFYRIQVSRRIAITPDAQFLLYPALNPEEDTIFVWGVRGRLAI